MAGVWPLEAPQEAENLLSRNEPRETLHIDDSHRSLSIRSNRQRHGAGLGVSVLSVIKDLGSISWSWHFRNLAHFLKPSFLQRSTMRAKIQQAKLYPTAFLDGMRGLAALCVVISHWTGWIYSHRLGWGANGGNHDFMRLPFICSFYHGSVQVAIFYVISGYVVSYRPIQYMRSGKITELHRVLSSLMLRRWARLFLPTAISTLIIVFLLQTGVYELTRDFHEDKKYMTFRIERHVTPLPTFGEELCNWVQQQRLVAEEYIWDTSKNRGLRKLIHLKQLTLPAILTDETKDYDSHLWTIPVEFRCSLYVFLTILGTSSLQVVFRFALIFVIMAHAWYGSRSEVVLFLSGMIIAESDVMRRAAHAPSSLVPAMEVLASRQARRWSIFWAIMSIAALFLLSQPEVDCKSTPGWITLCQRIPDWIGQGDIGIWYQRLGAVLWVASVSRLQFWRRLYNTSIIQYLGKISYSLYLVHGMSNHTVGLLIEMLILKYVTGVEGNMKHVGFIVSTLLFFPLTIWFADIFCRAVDQPLLGFIKWVEGKSKMSGWDEVQ